MEVGPSHFFKIMDKDGDGLLTEDELHVGVRDMFPEQAGDAKEFEKHVVPVLRYYFPKSDADSDGKLNLEEFQAFMKMEHEHEAEESTPIAVSRESPAQTPPPAPTVAPTEEPTTMDLDPMDGSLRCAGGFSVALLVGMTAALL